MANISKRDWIQWKTEPPGEPTNTLVLTSPERRFVDIRILKDPPDMQQPAGIRLLAQLDWAFAGTSSSTWHNDPDSGQKITHSKWAHWVDSRHVNAEAVVDEADMVPTIGEKVIERGRMVNPANGQMTDYEECWADVAACPTEEGGEVEVAVLVMQNDKERERGMVVRVGQFCQGVVRVGEGIFALERWEWTGKGGEEGWKRNVRMGDVWMPCGVAMDGNKKLEVGGKVRYKEHEWVVVELV